MNSEPEQPSYPSYNNEGERAQVAQEGEGEREGVPRGCTRFCSLAFYEEFFQVSQEEVMERIKLNFMPVRR